MIFPPRRFHMGEYLISVITPSYNQAEFLEKTLKSVKNQTHDQVEHIVVDGGSTDKSVDILKNFEDTYNLRWISEQDKGQAHAIQKGLDQANGDIYCWLNSDDIYLTDKALDIVAEAFRKYPEADVVSGKGIHINQEGRWRTPINRPDVEASYESIKYRYTILQPATFWKSSISDTLSFDYMLEYAFDWDYFISMFEKHDVLPIDDYIAGYRIWGGNKTVTGGKKRAKELREVTGRYIGRRSWQYLLMSIYYALLCTSTYLPEPLETHLNNGVSVLSKIIKRYTDYRITAV